MRKSIVLVFFALFFAGLFYTIYLDEHYFQTRPRKPDPDAGRVYPRTIHHGVVVYLTKLEASPFDYFWALSLPLFVAVVLNSRWKTFRQRDDGIPKKLY